MKYTTAQRLISIYSAQLRIGNGTSAGTIGQTVLAEIALTQEEDIQQALIAHVQAQVDAGKGDEVTTREVEALKKGLITARREAEARGDEVLDLRAEAAKLKLERDESRETMNRFKNDLIRIDKERKEERAERERAEQAATQRLRDAEEVYREQLDEAREKIRKEEASRPRTSAEEAAQKKRLAGLRVEYEKASETLTDMRKRARELEERIETDRRAYVVYDRAIGDFAMSITQFYTSASRLAVSARALRGMALSAADYDQIKSLKALADDVSQALGEAVTLHAQ